MPFASARRDHLRRKTALAASPAARTRLRRCRAYRIVQASASRTALAALEELALGGGAVALIVADQRMPAMSGVEPGFVLTGPELARPKTWQERREPFPSRPACPASSRPETSARSR